MPTCITDGNSVSSSKPWLGICRVKRLILSCQSTLQEYRHEYRVLTTVPWFETRKWLCLFPFALSLFVLLFSLIFHFCDALRRSTVFSDRLPLVKEPCTYPYKYLSDSNLQIGKKAIYESKNPRVTIPPRKTQFVKKLSAQPATRTDAWGRVA